MPAPHKHNQKGSELGELNWSSASSGWWRLVGKVRPLSGLGLRQSDRLP